MAADHSRKSNRGITTSPIRRPVFQQKTLSGSNSIYPVSLCVISICRLGQSRTTATVSRPDVPSFPAYPPGTAHTKRVPASCPEVDSRARATAYAEFRKSIVEVGLMSGPLIHPPEFRILEQHTTTSLGLVVCCCVRVIAEKEFKKISVNFVLLAQVSQPRTSSMRKMLCEIDLEKAQGYPGRYLESRPGGTVSWLRNLG